MSSTTKSYTFQDYEFDYSQIFSEISIGEEFDVNVNGYVTKCLRDREDHVIVYAHGNHSECSICVNDNYQVQSVSARG